MRPMARVAVLLPGVAQEFYQPALTGDSLGESARQACDAIRDHPGDPTWLSCTIYGDLAATMSTQPTQNA